MIFPCFGVVEVSLFVLSIGLSVLAGYLAKKKSDSPIQDEKPPSLATRGSLCPWLIGLGRIGPIICWVGGRTYHRESLGGKGGFGPSKKTKVWYEEAMHVIGIGPFHALHGIIANGEAIFRGPITADSHPSGSTVDLGHHGAFKIYWGEEDQPINTYLGDSERIGISSRWPQFCYIQWVVKRLGSTAVWPSIEYVVERHPQNSLLTSTSGWIEPDRTLDGSIISIDGVVNGAEGVGHFISNYEITYAMLPETFLRVSGNAIPDQDVEVLYSEIGMTQISKYKYTTYTKIYVVGGLSGADDSGTLQYYSAEPNDGANPAHAIADLLFEQWPKGFNLDQDFWDIESLDALGVLTESENLRTSWLSSGGDGETLEAMLATGLQDLGCLIPLDTNTGKISFSPIRTPSGDVPHISEDLIQDVPEILSNHMEKEADRIIFEIADRTINFRKMTFHLGDDGHASELQHQTLKKVPIRIVVNPEIASTVMERRELELLGSGAVSNLTASRGGRLLIPGDAVTVYGLPEVMRVSEIKIDTESGIVELSLLTDFYGVDATGFTHNTTSPNSGLEPAQHDVAFHLIEIPEYLMSPNSLAQIASVLRIRAHAQIISAQTHLSRDNSTYVLYGNNDYVCAGGTLDDAMPATDSFYQVQGPTITIEGPDIGEVLDLSGDTVSWGNGRQLAAIGDELFFVQNITALGGDSYRLDGLIRARYDTEREAHSAGDPVFIFPNDGLYLIQDVLLEPEVDCYVKSQPVGMGILPLSAIPPGGKTLYGKGIRPPKCSSLRVTAPNQVNAYPTGEDVTVKWCYPATEGPGTGAGLQGAGTAIGTADPPGQFKLEILTTLDVVVRTEILDNPTYTYDNTNIISDLGSETDFKVRVTQLRSGYASDPVTITVEAI
jgi:hypothetical protein